MSDDDEETKGGTAGWGEDTYYGNADTQAQPEPFKPI